MSVNKGLLTSDGKNILLDRGYNSSPTRSIPSVFKVGITQATPTTADTDLTYSIPISGTESVDDCETADWTDSADMTHVLDSTTYKEGSNSISLTKDGVASATATVNKTTTSRDFTSKNFCIWIYFTTAGYAAMATTDCIEIRFGSDSSNYYYYTRDKADLAEGWNYIEFSSTSADGENGTVTIAACDYTYIGVTADAAGTTWSDGDVLMDDIKVASSDDYVDTFTSGYPSLDSTNNEVEIRGFLSTADANGYEINGAGLFNTDGTPLCHSVDRFSAISKSSSDEISIIWKDRIQ